MAATKKFWVFILLCVPWVAGCQDMPELMDVTLVSPAGEEHRLQVEVADEPSERQQGLMGRQKLPPLTGMLFVWPTPRPVDMWMKNTPLSLDMLFLRDGLVIKVISNTVPGSEALLRSDAAVTEVLELPAGTAKQLNVTAGWHLLTPLQNP